jgi:anaerobic magnesium-protoporphyrin IX monomethyl ester cyclase
MKVLFIVPTFGYTQGYPRFLSSADFPAGFAYLASATSKAGHQVFGLNPNNDTTYKSAHEMVADKISKSILKNKPDVIGLGGLSTDYKFIKDSIGLIRNIDPKIQIVMGGGIINFDAEYIFSALHPDFCIIGEAEENFVKLLQKLGNSDNNYDDVHNLGYWKDDVSKFTKKHFQYVALDERAFPDYEPFEIKTMLDEYSMATRYVYRNTRPYPRPLTIVSARGCPFSCTFCVHDREGKYRARSIDNIMDEIKLLHDKYHFNNLIILDELFVAKKERLREFSMAILNGREKYGWDFDWIFQTHANSSLDRDVLALAKKAGCYCFTY